MLLVLNTLLFLAGRHVAAVPLSYVSGPTDSSTVDILLSSVITLTLCFYTSIRLNIAPQKKLFGFSRVWVYRVYWALIAIMAPEFVLYAAYIQWRNARMLCEELKKLDPGHQEEPTPPMFDNPEKSKRSDAGGARKWSDITMVSAFFVVMGGYAYDVPHLSDDHQYIALTPRGFLELARANLILPSILNNEIAHRSKAGSLGKLLFGIQALWAVVNFLARKASGKTTTLMELEVMIQVMIAFFVRVLWWHKPLAITHPTYLSPTTGTVQSETTAADRGKALEEGLLAHLELVHHNLKISPDGCDILSPVEPVVNNDQAFNLDKSKFEIRSWTNDPASIDYRLSKSDRNLKLSLPGFVLLPGQFITLKDHHFRAGNSRDRAVVVTEKTLHCLESACLFRRRQRENQRSRQDHQEKSAADTHAHSQAIPASLLKAKGMTTTDPPNYYVHGSLYTGRVEHITRSGLWEFGYGPFAVFAPIPRLVEDTPLMFPWGVLSCFYACSHAIAWSSPFPTELEEWIWRVSCLAIGGAIPSILVIWATIHPKCIWGYPKFHLMIDIVLYPLVILAAISYILARLLIPVEVFFSMRSLPIEAIDAVDWADFWLHI
jgi:hypothetical protein